MVRALQGSFEIERIARSETCHIPLYDPYSKARALYRWMRSSIAYDTDRYEKIVSGSYYGVYRNSVETLRDRMGVCGEQAMLYIMLARYVGLDAIYARNNQRPGHAIARVHCPAGIIDVDTTKDGPTGFDRKDTYYDFFEVQESELDELVNRDRAREYFDDPHVEPENAPDHLYGFSDRYHPQRIHHHFARHDHASLESRIFLIAVCFAIPWLWSMAADLEFRPGRARPTLVSEQARPYVMQARDLASRGYGGGLRSFESLKKRFDFDSDGILDRYEACAMYRGFKVDQW